MVMQTTGQADDTKIVQLVIFHLGEEEFGVHIGEIREIIKAGVVTPVPDSPDFIRGLINVRGDIVATIDLRARFSMRLRKTTDTKHTVITKQQDILFGLMVDEVTEVLRIPETEIKTAPKLVTRVHDDYVTGVLPLDNRLIVLLDLARVLSAEELARLSEMNREAHPPEDITQPDSAELEAKQLKRNVTSSGAMPSGRPIAEYATTAGGG